MPEIIPKDDKELPEVIVQDSNDGSIYTKRVPLAKAWVYYLNETKTVSQLEALKGSPIVYGDRVFRNSKDVTIIPDKPFHGDCFNAWTPPVLPPPIQTKEDLIRAELVARGVSQEVVDLIDPLIEGLK